MPHEYGKKVWCFPDGDLPAAGDVEPRGHESLVLLNPNDRDAHASLTIYFTDRPPHTISGLLVGAQRVRCIRMDKPIDGYQVPFGQYALKVESDTGLVAQIGRMDVQQPNLAYYTTMGYPT